MQDIVLPPNTITIEGLEGLRAQLDLTLEKSLSDEAFAKQEHYLLYKLAEQRALIKLDFSQKPFQFWYGDLMGRPATKGVKETIAQFLIDHGLVPSIEGEKHAK